MEGLLVCPALGLLTALSGSGSLGLDLDLGFVLLGLRGLLGANGQGLLDALLGLFSLFALLGTGDRLCGLSGLAGAVAATAAGLDLLRLVGSSGVDGRLLR